MQQCSLVVIFTMFFNLYVSIGSLRAVDRIFLD